VPELPATRPRENRVQLSANGRQVLLIQTGPSGRFHATVPPGFYIARAFTGRAEEGLCRPARLIRITVGRTAHLRLTCINQNRISRLPLPGTSSPGSGYLAAQAATPEFSAQIIRSGAVSCISPPLGAAAQIGG